ncbi:MAG: CDP-alcohol phosphatidyltransferase family protein [Promethearchaeati archaeon]
MIDNFLTKTKLKQIFEKFFQKKLQGKITANMLTALGLLTGIISAFIIFLSSFLSNNFYILLIATIFLIISFFLDTLDGVVARKEGSTAFGGVLDLFCDRTVEIVVIISIISTNKNLLWPGVFTLAAIILCITVFLAIGGAVNEKNLKENEKMIYYARGIMERGETFLFLTILILLISLRYLFLWIFAILIFLTALQRLIHAYKLFEKEIPFKNSAD